MKEYKFEIGDKVVCIDNFFRNAPYFTSLLQIGKTYTVIDTNYGSFYKEIKVNGLDYNFTSRRFIPLTVARKDKLRKILSNVGRTNQSI